MRDRINQDQLITILHDCFGFKSFRRGQLEAISTLMEQERLLCIQPTGYGKSLIYQLPSVLLDGITLVISPLLALMRDQILQLSQRFNIRAASINTDQTEEENTAARLQTEKGLIKILFVAPEQLDNIVQLEFLLALPISLLVIDEAHCISTWGHDFRPSYRQIIQLIRIIEKRNPQIKVLGLTATANYKTEEDIKLQLSSENREVQIHRESLDRPNIQLTVLKVDGYAKKLLLVKTLVEQLAGEGLIYCATRENTELVAEFLQKNGINATSYHAGLDANAKRKLQSEFIRGKYKVIAATNALGMGIDKADLRFIIHFDVPGSITAYYQEVGRAGRDGLPAKGILLFDAADKKIQEYFINSAQPTTADFYKVLQAIKLADMPPKITDIKRLVDLHPTMATVVVAELVEQGYLRKLFKNNAQVYLVTDKEGQGEPNLERYENQLLAKSIELSAISNYAEQNTQCRMVLLRQALGDTSVEKCGHCDICREPQSLVQDDSKIKDINIWLSERVVTINAISQYKVSPGIAIFDGKIRSSLFIRFMQERVQNKEGFPELLELIKKSLVLLVQRYCISSVIVIPSNTWYSRYSISCFIANQLKASLLLDYLYWQVAPTERQGNLLNNDQRRYNVANKMTAKLHQSIPKGTILLLDDYIGSGATMREAAHVLRNKANLTQEIIPFTLATIKWRLGKRGMI